MKFQPLRHWLIRSRWRRWLAPALCAVPYIGSIVWLLLFSQVWIAMVLLVPALLMIVLAALTLFLAQIEFHGQWRKP